jgi:hypothetical protein
MRYAWIALVLVACGGSPVVGNDAGSTVTTEAGVTWERCSECVATCANRMGMFGPVCAPSQSTSMADAGSEAWLACSMCGAIGGDPAHQEGTQACADDSDTPATTSGSTAVSCWRN